MEELDDIPETSQPVIFSAHGVPKAVPAPPRARNLFLLDATCPLVYKVHVEAARHHAEGLEILLIGHAGHPEVVGTMGQLPDGAVRLIETVAQARTFVPRDPNKLAFVTQTTLSVDDTSEIVAVLKARFPDIVAPHKEDICYATANRQEAVKAIAPMITCLFVVGSPQSSNSQRLVEVAKRAGCANARLIQRADDIRWGDVAGAANRRRDRRRLGARSAGRGGDRAFRERFDVRLETVTTARSTSPSTCRASSRASTVS